MKDITFITVFVFFVIQTVYSDWEKLNGPVGGQIYAIISSGNDLLVGTYGGGIFYSSNNGSNWTQRNNGITEMTVAAFGQKSPYIFTASNNGIYRTSNNGQSWALTALLPGNSRVISFYTTGSYIFAGTRLAGVYRSSNNGITWHSYSNGITSQEISTISGSGSYIFVGTLAAGVFRSTNDGESWTSISNGLGNLEINSLYASGSVVYAATDNGLYRSGNYGAGWTIQNNGLSITGIYRVIFTGGNIFAGTYLGGVYVSNNSGQSFIARNEGFETDELIITSFLIFNNYIFAGSEDFDFNIDFWRRSLNEVISVKNISSETPEDFSLSQNYPNPFNPVTKIQFAIPHSALVKLSVFDLLGRELEVLLNEQLKPGYYEVDFEGSSYSSGVYFYKLITDGFSDTKKMVLVK